MSRILIKHYGYIKNGRKFYLDKDLYHQQLTSLEGKNFVEIIQERKKKTSLSQYAFYRGAILGAFFESEEFRHFDKADDIHEFYLAPKFLSYKKMIIVGDESIEVTLIRSMADLSRGETSELIERVIALAAEKEIEILSPDQYYEKSFGR